MTRRAIVGLLLLGLIGSAAPHAGASGHDRPAAPPDLKASAGAASAVVSWEAPASLHPLTYYWVEAYRGGRRVDGRRMSASTTALRFDGLINGTSYTFTVYATSTAGDGPTSAQSRAVTPNENQPSGPPGTLAARPAEHRTATTQAARSVLTAKRTTTTRRLTAAQKRKARKRAQARRARATTTVSRPPR